MPSLEQWWTEKSLCIMIRNTTAPFKSALISITNYCLPLCHGLQVAMSWAVNVNVNIKCPCWAVAPDADVYAGWMRHLLLLLLLLWTVLLDLIYISLSLFLDLSLWCLCCAVWFKWMMCGRVLLCCCVVVLLNDFSTICFNFCHLHISFRYINWFIDDMM